MKTKILNLLKINIFILAVIILNGNLADAQNISQFVSINAPAQVAPGQTFTATVVFKNTGTTTWTTGGNMPYRLGTQNPQDNETWGRLRVELPASSILTGQNATFTFSCTAPTTPGSYNFQWKMVKELVEWFGAFSTNKIITVAAPLPTLTNNSQFVSMTVPSQVTPGQNFSASITFKNTHQMQM